MSRRRKQMMRKEGVVKRDERVKAEVGSLKLPRAVVTPLYRRWAEAGISASQGVRGGRRAIREPCEREVGAAREGGGVMGRGRRGTRKERQGLGPTDPVVPASKTPFLGVRSTLVCY